MTRIPRTDSVQELARFWDTHDVTEFEDELQEVPEPVFDREAQTIIHVRLNHDQTDALHRIAQSKGMKDADLLKEWVSEKLDAS
jgi:ATP-dependent DNA ligase